jgi:hypothetical protein
MRRSFLIALALCLTTLACNLPLPAPPVEYQAPTVTPSPPPEISEQPILPGDLPSVHSASDHARAMRPGFEQDVDAFIDGLYYQINLTLTTDPVVVNGIQRTHYINTIGQALPDVVFRLHMNGLAHQRVMEIGTVAVDGQPAQFDFEGEDSVLRIRLAKPLAPDASVDIDLSYRLNLPDNLNIGYDRSGVLGDVIVLSSFLPIVSVYGEDGWWIDSTPELGDPGFSESALWSVRLTAPSDFKAVFTGTALQNIQNFDHTTTYEIVTGPVRDFSLALSTKFETDTETADGVTVTLWSLPGTTSDDRFALNQTIASIRAYDKHFGAYPLADLDVVETDIQAGGIEYPGLIYVASDYWDQKDEFFEVIISHEVGHQWWYSMVGNDQINQPWLDEALATYSEIVYYTEVYGARTGNIAANFNKDTVENFINSGGKRLPIDLPVSAYSEQEYSVFVYDAGASFYSQLAEKYGDQAVDAMLQTWYSRYRYQIATTDEMRTLVEETFGVKGAAFFDQWILNK